MIRVLFSVLAVVAAVLAIVMEQPLLYAAAAAMVLIVFILWLTVLRQRHRKASKAYVLSTKAPPQPEENLKALGIMDIRPKEPSKKPKRDADVPTAQPETPRPIRVAETPALPNIPVEKAPVEETADLAEPIAAVEPSKSHDERIETTAVAEPSQRPRAPAETPVTTPSPKLKEFVIQSDEAGLKAKPPRNGRKTPASAPYHDAVLRPYLQALRAALGAHTVCVLKQEDVAFDYHVVALVGEEDAPKAGRVFSATVPLMTAGMARQPVTVRRVGADDLPPASLGYSATPGAIRQVALAPAPRRTDPDAYFLLADTRQTDLLDHPRAQTLLAQFARLLGTLLDVPVPEAPLPESASTEPVVASPMRPRREIIAEEMEHARARNQLLALALVYLNRAEDIAGTDEEAVAEAEYLLKARLQEAASNGRVVRFGELTYGVFYDGDLPEVEAWGAQIQNALSHETGLLEGGVSIGIALLQDRHQTPDAFRADATEALREAYETGTCTILG